MGPSEEGSLNIVTLLLTGRATPYLHNGVIYVGDEDHYVSVVLSRPFLNPNKFYSKRSYRLFLNLAFYLVHPSAFWYWAPMPKLQLWYSPTYQREINNL